MITIFTILTIFVAQIFYQICGARILVYPVKIIYFFRLLAAKDRDLILAAELGK